jgi:hypothetical protein
MFEKYHPNGIIPLKFLQEHFNEKIIQHRPWLHACIFVFNKNCQWFFQECNSLYENFKHLNYFWIHDELFFNYLISKYNFTNHMDVKVLNIFNTFVFDEYLESETLSKELFNKSEATHDYDICPASILPTKNEDLCLFHGITDVNYSKKVLERYINNIIKV